MLTFRAIKDYKGIRKGEIWELLNIFDENEYVKRYAMIRRIDIVTKTIFLFQEELEENFEWISVAAIERHRRKIADELKNRIYTKNVNDTYAACMGDAISKIGH